VLAHGLHDSGFWWAASIFAFGAVVAGLTFRRGPLVSQSQPDAGLTIPRQPAPPAVHS
jgi:hypothetical protein